MSFTDTASWASILGLILGIPSLIFSIMAFKEAKKSAKESKDAKSASLSALNKLGTFSVIADFTAALSTLADIKTLVRNSTFGPIPEKIDRLVSVLQRVKSGDSNDESIGQTIASAIENFRTLQGEIELANLNQSTPGNPHEVLSTLSNLSDSLEPVLLGFNAKLKSDIP